MHGSLGGSVVVDAGSEVVVVVGAGATVVVVGSAVVVVVVGGTVVVVVAGAVVVVVGGNVVVVVVVGGAVVVVVVGGAVVVVVVGAMVVVVVGGGVGVNPPPGRHTIVNDATWAGSTAKSSWPTVPVAGTVQTALDGYGAQATSVPFSVTVLAAGVKSDGSVTVS